MKTLQIFNNYFIEMQQIYSIDNIKSLSFDIQLPSIIFLKWDLGAGKTTLSKHILQNIFWVEDEITSPTYTYYNKYNGTFDNKKEITIYHFDLYRLSHYDEFFAIWGEEILDNNKGIILIEWPEILEKYYEADMMIFLEKMKKENERNMKIAKKY